MIDIQDVTIEQGGRVQCQQLSWQLPDPGNYLLLGSNGSGKTLLSKLLTGRLKPKRGRVLIDGRTVYGHLGVQCDCWYSHAEQSFHGDELLSDYLEQELVSAGGQASALLRIWPLLELKLGGRRIRMSQLSHGEALLAEAALAACVPQRLVILDGHLSYLDPVLGQAATQLLQTGIERNDRFILLTASRLIDYHLDWRQVFALDGGLPIRITNLNWQQEQDSSIEQVSRRLVLYPAGDMGPSWQLASGISFAVTGVQEGGGWQVKLLGTLEQMLEELREQGITLARMEWNVPPA